MREKSKSEGKRRRSGGEAPPADEDFLFHLSRASEMLVQNRVVDAKEELEHALAYRPRDAQGQDLLAGVYFRLGVYPQAIQLWRSLLPDFPGDVTLRVNLGLALFKTGQPDEACEELERALEMQPDHARAWGYLGLVRWRLGKTTEAREAFLKGGQHSMAKRLEEEVESAAIPIIVDEPEPPDDARVTAVRDAARDALDRLNQGDDSPALALAAERPNKPSGHWRVVETGADPVPVKRSSRPIPAAGPPTLTAAVEGWSLSFAEGVPLGVSDDGELCINTTGAVHARLSGVRAVRGVLKTERVSRRSRGRNENEQLGGDIDPILRWSGPIVALHSPPAGYRYCSLRVDETLLYVRERYVQAFDDRVGYESGRLPLTGDPEVLLSFHGQGVVVLRLARRPSAIQVEADQEVSVDPDALVGWTGRLFPTRIDDPNPPSLALAFRGQGILLVT